jgi:hypothetical protein
MPEEEEDAEMHVSVSLNVNDDLACSKIVGVVAVGGNGGCR